MSAQGETLGTMTASWIQKPQRVCEKIEIHCCNSFEAVRKSFGIGCGPPGKSIFSQPQRGGPNIAHLREWFASSIGPPRWGLWVVICC